jgi:hypothetical protein
MATFEMECPKCGASGKIPRNKVQTRLVCRKCLAIFHVNPLGRSVLGEPPTNEPARHDSKPAGAATEKGLSGSSVTGILISAAVLVLLLALLGAVHYGFFNWGGESIADITTRATIATQAIADENVEKFMATVLPGTESEAIPFFDHARLSLHVVRRKSPTKEIVSTVQLQEVSNVPPKAKVLAVFMPNLGTTRQQQLTEIDTLSNTEETAVLATLWLVKDDQGKWRLDGKRCTEVATAR